MRKRSKAPRSRGQRATPTRLRTKLPTVSGAKILEAKSRGIFAEGVSPWLVTEWGSHDYGIDAMVEVTRERGDGDDHDATGQRFAVQLKATEANLVGRRTALVRVRPNQIRYWLESTEPVLLVLCQVPSRGLHWRWIDQSIIEELNRRNPAWIGQQSVSIAVSTKRAFDRAALKEIEAVASSHRRGARRLLSPGAYAALQARLSAAAAELATHARAAQLQSVTLRLTDLERSVRSSTYVVVLTGPARAGKSTLLNALVRRDVSPVGRLPTTAVVLIVTAGAQDEADVVLADDELVRGAATAEFLAQYATQEQNPDNAKGVRMISVRLVSEPLEQGVAYADAPGLHDPSPVIRAVTETALQAAHAVLYVLDISPAKHGGFSISDHHIQDLKRLRSAADRLFIILNKADVLSSMEQEEVKGYVERSLHKYGLLDSLPVSPMLMSAQDGWEPRQRGNTGTSSLLALEEAIWTHLLRTSSTGVDRLTAALAELQQAANEFASLLATRRVEGAAALELRGSLGACRLRERELVAGCRRRAEEDREFFRDRLNTYREAVLRRTRQWLQGVPADQPLPSLSRIEEELQTQVLRLLLDMTREARTRFQNYSSMVSREVEMSLRQARMRTGAPTEVKYSVPKVAALNVAGDSFSEAWTGLFAGGVLGLLISGGWMFALAAGGWLTGLIVGHKARRKREVERIIDRAGAALGRAVDTVLAQILEMTRIYLTSLERHVIDRITMFVHDVEKQLQGLGTPLSKVEQERLRGCEQAVRRTLVTLEEAAAELGLASEPNKRSHSACGNAPAANG